MQLQSGEKAIRKSYSIPEDIAEMLEVEARRRDASPSALLAQLLKKSLTFDLPLQRIGTIIVPEPCFQAMVDNIPPEKLQEVAGGQSDKNFGLLLSLLDGHHNLESVIQSYYEKFGRYSGWYSFRHIAAKNGGNDGVHQLILQHTRGIKWSKYLANYNKAILGRFCEKVECTVDDKVVVFDVMAKESKQL